MFAHNTLQPNDGATRKQKRIWRWNGSGMGTYSGRGVKGQGARTGKGKFNAAFEWGQTPLFRRLPKWRGFTQWKQQFCNIVNVSQLQKLADSWVTEFNSGVLVDAGIIRANGQPLKILGNGEIQAKISIIASKVSKEAQSKIEKAGGSIQLI